MPTRFFRVLLLSMLVPIGCATLPDHARPRVLENWDRSTRDRDAFTYRKLDVGDFRAERSFMGGHGDIAAHVCTRIRPTASTRVRIVPAVYMGKVHYFGSVDFIAFEAVVVPDCSWWNPENSPARRAYVIEHEQVHFALTELAARRLTVEAAGADGPRMVIGTSRGQAIDLLSGAIHRMLEAAMEVNLREQTRFDEETSLYHAPEAQRRWLTVTEEALRRLPSE